MMTRTHNAKKHLKDNNIRRSRNNRQLLGVGGVGFVGFRVCRFHRVWAGWYRRVVRVEMVERPSNDGASGMVPGMVPPPNSSRGVKLV